MAQTTKTVVRRLVAWVARVKVRGIDSPDFQGRKNDLLACSDYMPKQQTCANTIRMCQ